LAVVGALALVGLGLLASQRRSPPLRVDIVPTSTEPAGWDRALDEARRVDVNTADAAELERLPGVGPTLAARIVAHRARRGRFRATDELSQVPGIGPKTLEALKEHVTTQ